MGHRRPGPQTLAERGELRVESDPVRPSGRLLRQGGMDASYVDLADASHLEFDYMRWLRIVLRVARARRILHVGGGACALARALAAEDPAGRQEVCEIDQEVLALARQHLGLRRAPGLRVRQLDGRAHVAAQPDGSWDAIVLDAFVGARVPERLITAEALGDAARVAPLTLVNLVDNRAARDIRAAAAGMALAYPRVWMLGQRTGNTIVAGSRAAGPPDLTRVTTALAADRSPARVVGPARTAQIIGASAPLRDAGIALSA